MGCYADNIAARVLPNVFPGSGNTIEACVSTCQVNGFTYAGLENGLDNDLHTFLTI